MAIPVTNRQAITTPKMHQTLVTTFLTHRSTQYRELGTSGSSVRTVWFVVMPVTRQWLPP